MCFELTARMDCSFPAWPSGHERQRRMNARSGHLLTGDRRLCNTIQRLTSPAGYPSNAGRYQAWIGPFNFSFTPRGGYYMAKFCVLSATPQMREPADLWETRLDKKFRERAPKVVKNSD